MVERIYLVGFMGSGKTTVGKKLSQIIGYEFVDMDKLFEKRYKISIPSFFEKYDELLFRKLESENLKHTFKMSGVVVASGGGTPCYYQGVDEMNQNGVTVFLDMVPSALVNRLIHAKNIRPLIKGKSQEELTNFVETELQERIKYYKKARLTIDGLSVNVAQLAAQIIEIS